MQTPYRSVGSQPQAVMFPRLQAAVTAYVMPAELIAYVKAASLLPGVNRKIIQFLVFQCIHPNYAVIMYFNQTII